LPNGAYTFQVRSRDEAGNVEVAPTVKTFRVSEKPLVVLAPPGGSSLLRVYDSSFAVIRQFSGGATTTSAGVNAISADLDGDGTDEVLTLPANGVDPRLRVFSQRGSVIASAAVPTSKQRVSALIVAGDTNGDRRDEVIVATNSGSNPRVTVYEHSSGQLVQRSAFNPYTGKHPLNIRVAVGDVDGDGAEDIVTVPGAGVSPQVRVFSGLGKPKASFYAYGKTMLTGVQLILEDVNRDGTKEVITVPNAGSPAQVIVRTLHGKKLSSFHALPRTSRTGVSLAVANVDGDSAAEIVSIPRQGTAPRVSVFTWQGRLKRSFRPYPTTVRSIITLSAFDHDANGAYSIITSLGQAGRVAVRQFSGTGRQEKVFSAPGSAVGEAY